PSPFWIDRTTVSGPIRGEADCAADSTCIALVATITRSQRPASAGLVVAWIGTVRSPDGPSRRRPLLRIACTCSLHASMAHTSCPADASNAAYTLPIAPQPSTAIFIVLFPCKLALSRAIDLETIA